VWWLFVRITLPSKIWTKWSFWRISPPFEPRMRIVNSFWCNLIVEEECCFIAVKTYQTVLLFKTLPLHHFEWVFPRLFAGSPFLSTLSKSIWIPHNLEDIHDNHVAIDHSMASPTSLSPWSWPYPSFIGLALCISRPVSYQGAPCLWC
jgi:hypothetical protein